MAGSKKSISIVGNDLLSAMLAVVLSRSHDVIALAGQRSEQTHQRSMSCVTIPYVTTMLSAIADRFQIDELNALVRFETARDVLKDCCAHRHISFVHHDSGSETPLRFDIPAEHSEYSVPYNNIVEFLFAVANRRGVLVLLQPCSITDCDDGWQIVSPTETYCCDKLIDTDSWCDEVDDAVGSHARDATRESVATYVNSIQRTPPLETLSSNVNSGKERATALNNLKDGTVHYFFEDGLVVISPSTEHGTQSVYLTLTAMTKTPSEWLASQMLKQPLLRELLGGAEPKGSWHSLGPYSSLRVIDSGKRVCFYPLKRGTVLFFREFIQVVDWAMLVGQQFQMQPSSSISPPNGPSEGPLVDYAVAARKRHDWCHDSLPLLSQCFPLLNAVAKLWLLDSILSTLSVRVTYRRCRERARRGETTPFDRYDAQGRWACGTPTATKLIEDCEGHLKSISSGLCGARQASESIFDNMNRSDVVPPIFGFGIPDELNYRLTLSKCIKTVKWVILDAPSPMQKLLVNYAVDFVRENISNLFKVACKQIRNLSKTR